MQKDKILIVEDERILSMELEMKLQDKGFSHIKCTSAGEKAID